MARRLTGDESDWCTVDHTGTEYCNGRMNVDCPGFQALMYRRQQEKTMEPSPHKPWWNDSDKVAGLITTILFLTGVIIVCVVVVGFTLRWAF